MDNKYTIPPNPANVPKELLLRYATSGPRYTSYPTAPKFKADADPAEIYNQWVVSNCQVGPQSLSFYVHVPFCEKRCRFCGCFTSIPKDDSVTDRYLESLKKEFQLVSSMVDPERPVKQLSFGGGTPTYLTPDRFDRMMREMKEIWKYSDDAEISVEIDPRTVTKAHVDVLLSHGFNRFSMGVQDFNPDVLEIIGRPQSIEDTTNLVSMLKEKGHNAINFDLIYGLPGQTLKSIKNTALKTVELSPSRIALYSYAHVPWMKKQQKVLEKYSLPNAEEKLALFGAAYEIFVNAGYIPVGMDHFAKADDDMVKALQSRTLHRNFMGYTTRRGLDLIGFGVSAISSVNRTYVQNTKDFEHYHNSMDDDTMAMERGYFLSLEDEIRRNLIIDLFCNFYLDKKDFSEKWRIDFDQKFASELKRLEPMQDDGLVNLSKQTIEITPLGHAFIRNVCMVFDEYLEQNAEERRYSQTI